MSDERPLVLCIDDDPDVLSFLEILLQAEGYAFVGASSAEQGLEIFAERQPAAIIVDLMMEEVDAGANFVKELRLRGNRSPVFMLSSVGDNLTGTIDYAELGLAGVFQKPVDKRQLLALLAARLA